MRARSEGPAGIPIGYPRLTIIVTIIFIKFLVIMHDMKLMLKFKLYKPRRRKEKLIEKTIKLFKDCVNDWIEALGELGDKPSRSKVHKYAYRRLREKYKELHTDVLQEAMDLAIEIYRGWMKNRSDNLPKFEEGCIYFEGRCVKFDRHFISLPLAGKRVWLPMYVQSKFKKYFRYNHGRVILKKSSRERAIQT